MIHVHMILMEENKQNDTYFDCYPEQLYESVYLKSSLSESKTNHDISTLSIKLVGPHRIGVILQNYFLSKKLPLFQILSDCFWIFFSICIQLQIPELLRYLTKLFHKHQNILISDKASNLTTVQNLQITNLFSDA